MTPCFHGFSPLFHFPLSSPPAAAVMCIDIFSEITSTCFISTAGVFCTHHVWLMSIASAFLPTCSKCVFIIFFSLLHFFLDPRWKAAGACCSTLCVLKFTEQHGSEPGVLTPGYVVNQEVWVAAEALQVRSQANLILRSLLLIADNDSHIFSMAFTVRGEVHHWCPSVFFFFFYMYKGK